MLVLLLSFSSSSFVPDNDQLVFNYISENCPATPHPRGRGCRGGGVRGEGCGGRGNSGNVSKFHSALPQQIQLGVVWPSIV